MSREDLISELSIYCANTQSSNCKLCVGGWDVTFGDGECLHIVKATDRDLDRALKLINSDGSINTNDYQALAMRTNDGKCSKRVYDHLMEKDSDFMDCLPDPGDLLNGALGLTGEAGEVADMIKKYIFHGHDLDREELVKELGDVCWYVALLCTTIDIDLSEVMSRNIEKLKARYPEGFSESASINRTE